MTLFDGRRLTQSQLHLDIERLRRGYYSDRYFENIVRILEGLHHDEYRFAGSSPRSIPPGVDIRKIDTGDLKVEAQYFNRRSPQTLIAGVDVALAMLRHGAGYVEGEQFVETWRELDVEAVEDGALAQYDGDPLDVVPVIKVRGRYRDFALLETAMLGVMTRATRIATNVYDLLQVTNGKPILFFPARFDLPDVQPIDGYAYWLAVQRYNHDHPNQRPMRAFVSTEAQGAWWGGHGVGTIPHSLIACFLSDTAETMLAYARYVPVDVPRVALVDFNNDTVGASLAVINAFWPFYREAVEAGDEVEKKRWTLNGVRLDTSKNVRDVSLDESDPGGVNPKLIRLVRSALDHAWEGWHVPDDLRGAAQTYCRSVQIVVTGGFDRERIQQYEADGVPVDIYGVGSRLLQNDAETNSDYTMDVVRVQLDGIWVDMAKVGRQPAENPELKHVDLSLLE